MEENTKKAAFELLGDPLSSVTRATRKTLFVLSSICILVGYTGVVPDEASILGFKFPGLTQNLINYTLFVLVCYSFISFTVHLCSDFFRHRIALDRYSLSRASDAIASMYPPDDEQDYHDSEFRRETGYVEKHVPHSLTKTLVFAKIGLDFIFPVVFGLLAIFYFFIKRL
jgi:hypothetical protein